MHHDDDPTLRAKRERLEFELERERLERERLELELIHEHEDPRAAGPGSPSALRLRVERALLAGVSLLALALGAQTLGHRCPEPPPALPARAASPDAGAPADAGALDRADADDGAPEEEEEEDDADAPGDGAEGDCPADPGRSEPTWMRPYLRLETLMELADGPWAEPIPWALVLPDEFEGFFPAVSRDGKTVVQIYDEAEGLTGEWRSVMVIFSVATGKVVGEHILRSTLEEQEASEGSLKDSELLRRREAALKAANRVLGAAEWRRLSTARSPSRPCPGAPWRELDEERSRLELLGSPRIARFDEEGIDLEYDPEREEITIRALQEDGTLRASVARVGLVRPGTWAEGAGCGSFGGIDGFGSRELGTFFVFGADVMIAGDLCFDVPASARTGALRLPPALRAAPGR